MMADIKAHAMHYALLGAWLSGSLLWLTLWRQNQTGQFWVVLGTALGYVLWGVIHHRLLRDLSFKIVLEYFLVAALVVIIIGGVMLQT